MKIKIAICTKDREYVERLVDYFNAHYYERFIWNLYTDIEYLQNLTETGSVDILLLGEEYRNDEVSIELPLTKDCIKAWLVEHDLDSDDNEKEYMVIKYQPAENINRKLLEIYSQKSNINYTGVFYNGAETVLYAFVSPRGGSGTSTAAIAAAKKFAQKDNVLYLNLESISGADLIFEGKNRGLEEIIFSLKKKRKALELKLESLVEKDKSGVFFFKGCDNAVKLGELNEQDIRDLLSAIVKSGRYDKVIMDIGNSVMPRDLAALGISDRIIIVTENNNIAAVKLERYLETLRVAEQIMNVEICPRLSILINRAVKGIQLPVSIRNIRVACVLPRIDNGTYAGVIDWLSDFESIEGIN